jgi:predicted ABC-type ATPase
MAPVLAIFCGPNGSGKSTLTNEILRRGVDLGTYVNPDDIAADLTGPPEERTRAAQKRADELREQCLAERRDFAFETVFSHPSKLAFMERAAAAGYEIHVFFVSLPTPEMNVERVRLRVASGGHDVPRDRIVARWERVMAMLPEIVRRAHRVMIFDNGSPPEAPIIRLVAFGRRDDDGHLRLEREADAPAWVETRLPSDGRY